VENKLFRRRLVALERFGFVDSKTLLAAPFFEDTSGGEVHCWVK
jgi:hypothetical protein